MVKHGQGADAVIGELDTIVLEAELPDCGLARGDIGTVVLVHGDGVGYEVEFTAVDGSTVAVVSLSADQVRPATHGEIPHARTMQPAST